MVVNFPAATPDFPWSTMVEITRRRHGGGIGGTTPGWTHRRAAPMMPPSHAVGFVQGRGQLTGSPMIPTQDLRSAFLGELRIEVAGSHVFGETPMGTMRRIDYFGSGHFKGPRIDARIVKGGADALLQRFDGVIQPDVRLVLDIAGGHHLLIQYKGYRHAAPEVMEQIACGEMVRPEEVYLRTALFFETDSKDHDWLNRMVAVGVGRREPKAAVYDVFEIL